MNLYVTHTKGKYIEVVEAEKAPKIVRTSRTIKLPNKKPFVLRGTRIDGGVVKGVTNVMRLSVSTPEIGLQLFMFKPFVKKIPKRLHQNVLRALL